jgi:hypothetical protein
VFTLVLASFVIALTPVVLDLAWRLASWIGQAHTPAVEGRESSVPLPSVKRARPSIWFSSAAGFPCPGAASPWASDRRGPARARSERVSA